MNDEPSLETVPVLRPDWQLCYAGYNGGDLPKQTPQRDRCRVAPEQGERFTVAVAGWTVAELGPLPGRRSLAAPERLAAILAETPPGRDLAMDLRQMHELNRESARDPWAA